jgi:hypothetical protein
MRGLGCRSSGLLVGISRVTQVFLGLIAAVIGVLNVKDFNRAWDAGPHWSFPSRRERRSTRGCGRS